MKKLLLLTLVAILGAGQISAQEPKLRKGYFNLNYAAQQMSANYEGLEFKYPKSKIGAGFTVGRTFFLHKEPLAGLVRIGLDATFFDLNWAQYDFEGLNDDGEGTVEIEIGTHQLEAAVGIGPSVTISPVKRLNIQGYFRFMPSYSLLYQDETLFGNFGAFFATGGSVSFGAIGVGAEARFGSCKYKNIKSADDFDKETSSMPDEDMGKLKTNGMRVYLTFRF